MFREALALIAFVAFNALLAIGGFLLFNFLKASLLPITILLPLAFSVFMVLISGYVVAKQFDEWKYR